jgi:hypothetical protein
MAPYFLVHENETSAEPTVLKRYQLRGKNYDVQFVYEEASTPNPPDTTVIPQEWNVFGARAPRLI